MVSDTVINTIVDLLQAAGIDPEDIQRVIDLIQDEVRDALVDLLVELDVPQVVIQYILELLPYV